MGNSIYDPAYSALREHAKKALPSTYEAVAGIGESVGNAYDAGGIPMAIGQLARENIGVPVAFAKDKARSVASSALPVAQTLNTLVTGSLTPIGQPAPAAPAAPAAVARAPVPAAAPARPVVQEPAAPAALPPAAAPAPVDFARSSRAEGTLMGLTDMKVANTGPYGDQGGIIIGTDKNGRKVMVGVSNQDVANRERERVAQVTKDSIAESNMRDAYIAATYGEKGAKERVAAMPKPKTKLEQMAESVQMALLDPKSTPEQKTAAAMTMKQFLGKDDAGEYKATTEETISSTGDVKKVAKLFNSKTGQPPPAGKKPPPVKGTPEYNALDAKTRADFAHPKVDVEMKKKINASRVAAGLPAL